MPFERGKKSPRKRLRAHLSYVWRFRVCVPRPKRRRARPMNRVLQIAGLAVVLYENAARLSRGYLYAGVNCPVTRRSIITFFNRSQPARCCPPTEGPRTSRSSLVKRPGRIDLSPGSFLSGLLYLQLRENRHYQVAPNDFGLLLG